MLEGVTQTSSMLLREMLQITLCKQSLSFSSCISQPGTGSCSERRAFAGEMEEGQQVQTPSVRIAFLREEEECPNPMKSVLAEVMKTHIRREGLGPQQL